MMAVVVLVAIVVVVTTAALTLNVSPASLSVRA